MKETETISDVATDLLGAEVISYNNTLSGIIIAQYFKSDNPHLQSEIEEDLIDVKWSDGVISHGVPVNGNLLKIVSTGGILYRPHRGGLQESMAEAQVFDTLEDLKAHVRGYLGFKSDSSVKIEKYSNQKDYRTGWDTAIVLVDGVPVGFTHRLGRLPATQMKRWDIWAEGWADNGGGSNAQCIATGVEASTFAEAVEKHAELNPEFKKYISKYQDGNYCYWGCRLFDNEGDARRFLG